ncbi:MAG: pyridoxamine 5'-phosphate oxidase [Phenylobacterium sp.]|jgi:pyridoxamine 5'-phosphate oxidase|uniref:pyridoxamine 5'-phosphate oxidase n=1 Tax=Phenylobacterium sp. TaxID=1871053 RepID=UPI0025E9A76D|nr:pyridoxamine 5'-phosphate oxidase [Phenylobacterium sp.]MCA3709037.1 pyridoxamine 5'-phosphate oxidase [Phenylobacterium sp.]MCA3716051.1 pyridoxamine 5'-phosphate oxidase [Phenylobacterium sp.]MCA3734754.1 pyridoxamine 5'-phosphate oxidase [Phenylobacterium sp.]MCA3738263.1 pyridoxamine 5'-phosphate oxidase [Phenylobacterium sp.]MCA3745359.1 pyridoxamine 5'-phosphate oxidase [Phenylobacterium sp.]
MTQKPPIPPSPTEDEYLKAVASADLPPLTAEDPVALFSEWLAEAVRSEVNDPNAMALATVDPDGLPDVRMVLLKDAGPDGFVFYTNLGSAKGRQLAASGKAALLFHWKSLRRQVRVRGTVSAVSVEEADAYWATRARPAQLGAWASQQSQPLPDRLAFERAIAAYGLKFGLGKAPRPPHWSGFRITPSHIEFWRDRPFRLHERLVFEAAPGGWTTSRLYP